MYDHDSREVRLTLYKWLVAPSPEAYRRLPAGQRPTIAQRLIPHSAAIDLVTEPEARTVLCQRPRDFVTAYMGTRLTWPRTLEEAVERDEQGRLHLTSEFEAFIVGNNSLAFSANFLAAFPECSSGFRR